jgi:phage tail tape-measure protein
LQALDRQLETTEVQARETAGGFTILKGAIATAIGTAAVQALQSVTSAVIGFGQSSVQTRIQFSQFRDQLELLEGSAAKGRAAFGQLSNFAAETPFELNEVVGAYVKLRQRGLQPTMDDLTKFGDLAKSQNKSLDQLIEAVLDATTR